MTVIRKRYILLMFLLLGLSVFMNEANATCTGASPNWTCTPDYTSIDNLINHNTPSGLTYNDTINVTAGTGAETWSSHLPITKACSIIGPGASNLTITSSYSKINSTTTDPLNYLIDYTPDATSRSGDYSFRLSGFSFDLDYKCGGIYLVNMSRSPIIPSNKIRIDHNSFRYTETNGTFKSIVTYGTIYGVVDNNLFDTTPGLSLNGYEENTWDNLNFNFGTSDNLYVEDNTFNLTSTYRAVNSGYGGRYVVRYNTFNYTSGGSIQWLDAHGNQVSGVYSTMGIEVYGNNISVAGAANSVQMVDQRGGKGAVFYNAVNDNVSLNVLTNVREEYGDCLSPTTNSQPQHVSDSYYWNNRKNILGVSTLINAVISQNCCSSSEAWQLNHSYAYQYCVSFNGADCFTNRNTGGGTSGRTEPIWDTSCGVGGTPLQTDGTVQWLNMGDYTGAALIENRDFFNQNILFNGTTGMGCGTLAARPATCTIGVGYWATNQSCSDLTGMVGISPSTPISGTLYKCTAPNVWTAYYTPYTYPHPLRLKKPSTPLDLKEF